MKKVVLFFSVFAIIVSSCSGNSDSDVGPTSSSINLVKKVVEFYADGKVNRTTTFAYKGNKIVSEIVKENDITPVSGDVGYNYKTEYTYTGNVITNVSVKNIFSNPERLVTNTVYSYDGNENLITSVREQYFDSFKFVLKILYTKIDKNTQYYSIFFTDTRDNIENPVENGKIIFDSNGNIIKMVSQVSDNYFSSFEYDTKFNAKKNILGFNKIIFVELPPNFNMNPYSPHLERSNTVLKSSIPGHYSNTYQYIYNADGYPKEMKKYFEYNGKNTLDSSFQYFYE